MRDLHKQFIRDSKYNDYNATVTGFMSVAEYILQNEERRLQYYTILWLIKSDRW